MAIKAVVTVNRVLIDDNNKVNYYYELSVPGMYVDLTYGPVNLGTSWTIAQPLIVAAAKTYAENIFSINFGLLDTLDFYRPLGGI